MWKCKMIKHSHHCGVCKKTWKCNRMFMDTETQEYCAHESNYNSICDKCLNKSAENLDDH